MAITFVGSAIGTVTSLGQTLGTIPITISGDNPLLVVSVISDLEDNATGMGFNGNSMTKASGGSIGGATDDSSAIWYMEAPPAGAGSVIATVTSSSSDRVFVAQNYAGALQSGALVLAGSAVGTSTLASFVGTMSEGSCLMVDAVWAGGNTPGTIGAGQTSLLDVDMGFFQTQASYEILGAATTIGTMSWGEVSDSWITSFAAFKSAVTAAGGGATVAGWKSLLGVGQG